MGVPAETSVLDAGVVGGASKEPLPLHMAGRTCYPGHSDDSPQGKWEQGEAVGEVEVVMATWGKATPVSVGTKSDGLQLLYMTTAPGPHLLMFPELIIPTPRCAKNHLPVGGHTMGGRAAGGQPWMKRQSPQWPECPIEQVWQTMAGTQDMAPPPPKAKSG